MVEHLARMPSGIPGLDDVLGGGFIEGASYIVQGRPGAGKTILSNQIAFSQAAAGRRVLYVTLLAETHDRLFQSLSTLSFFDKTTLGDTQQSKDRFITEVYDEDKDFPPVVDGKRTMPVHR